jgi:biopolymer transport protein ExbD
MRLSTAGRIGIALILVGPVLLCCATRWLAPHPHVALEMPISLSTGHIITGNFSVNPGTLYYIDIELDKRSPIRALCEPRSVLNTRWVLSSEEAVQQGGSPWEDTGLTIAALYSEKTRYAFDAEILSGASCLNARKPRLKVQTHPYPSDLYVALTWLSIVPVGIGLVLLTRPHISRRYNTVEVARMFPDMVLRNVLPIRKHAPLRLIHDPPHWPLFCVAILSFLIFAFMSFGPLPSKGLLVTLKNRDAVAWEKSPWPDALEVYVRAPARFFVSGQEVSRSDLHAKLIEQLHRRPEWTVYFEAEPDVAFMQAAYTIDTIQACEAKLVWITPKMREDWQQKRKESEATRRKAEPIFRPVPD